MKYKLFLFLLAFTNPVYGESESRKISLSKVDYRSRLALSVKVPEIGRIRIRGSIERRYRVKP
jgi:hypothetical protein